MNGLLDFIKTPEGQGLLSAAFGGLAGARRGAPLNSIGRAGLAGLTGYGNALEAQDQRAQQAAMQELRQLQVNQYKTQAEREAAAAAEKKRVDALLAGAVMPVSGTQANAATGLAGPTPQAAAAIGARPQIDANNLYAQGVPAERIKELFALQQYGKPQAELDKVNPKDYTPESVAKFATTKNYSDLVRALPKPSSPDAKIEQYEYAKKNGYRGSFEQFVTLGPALMAAAAAPLRQAQVEASQAATGYNYPTTMQAPKRSSGGVTVQAPDGRVFSFPDQKAANNFKLKAGIK